MDREIQFVTVGGHEIPAQQVICPVCHVLDLGSIFEVVGTPMFAGSVVAPTSLKITWKVQCSKGHEWEIEVPPVV